YIPIGILDSNIICTDLNNIIPGGDLFEFGIISSVAHNEWAKLVAGKLKSDYRYTSTIVYNTFPWPDVTEAQRKEIERSAEEVLLTREEFSGCTLAELYDPDKMPNALLAAHQVLDSAVDRLYRDRPFKDAADRLSCLLARYEALVGN
ncbi:MAG: type IIL restriction-modification enzyme MmeI, partial [Shewanella sp.]